MIKKHIPTVLFLAMAFCGCQHGKDTNTKDKETKDELVGVWKVKTEDDVRLGEVYFDFQENNKVKVWGKNYNGEWHRNKDTIRFEGGSFDGAGFIIDYISEEKLKLCDPEIKGLKGQCLTLKKSIRTSDELEKKRKEKEQEREEEKETSRKILSDLELLPIPEGELEAENIPPTLPPGAEVCDADEAPDFYTEDRDSLDRYVTNYIKKHVNLPGVTRIMGGGAYLLMGFYVLPDGTVEEPVILDGDYDSPFFANAGIQLVKSLPKYQRPAIKNGKPVKCFTILPVSIY